MVGDTGKTREDKMRATEEMLARYIFERKRPLAEFAFETLLELAPDHPNADEYRAWIAEIDVEATRQSRIEEALTQGRAALAQADFATAHQYLARLQKHVPDSLQTATLANELAQGEKAQEARADVISRKIKIDALLADGETDTAEIEINALASLDVPKVTHDFFRGRLAEVRAEKRSAMSLTRYEEQLEQQIAAQDFSAARETAHATAAIDPEASNAMLERVAILETSYRRRQTIAQGVATLERFIVQGLRAEAELALEVLRGLEIDAGQLALFRQRVERL